ncbi:hypothetical protein L204_102965 [Cryptococcus depauperatus]
MAYAYNTDRSAAASTSSLDKVPTRKNSDALADVIEEFKRKISEDEIYINFAQERIRLEKEYVEGLRRLYNRTLAIDTLHDDAPPRKSEKPTSRKAWAEVRDYTLREIEAREAMKEALTVDVVTELLRIKEQQTRIRNHLKDEIKKAEDNYDEHAKHDLPKLKKAYFQKCQALEDHKRQEHAIEMQARLLSTSQPPSPSALHGHPFAMGAGPEYTSPPTTTPLLPPMSNSNMTRTQTSDVAGRERPHTPGTSISISMPTKDQEKETKFGNRLRAGSASGLESKSRDVFNDLAAQGRKGFSAFMQKLGGDKEKEKDRDDGHTVFSGVEGEGLQRRGTAGNANSKAMMAVRGAKIKREADEADKAYRMEVFHLESLRLCLEKLKASSIVHLEEFNDDLSTKLRTAMDNYIHIVHSTAITQAQAVDIPRAAVDSIDADYDMRLFRQKMHASVGLTTIPPIAYENFYVGRCMSLIFGIKLIDYDTARGDGNDYGRPPAIVDKCIIAIEKRGLSYEGIYRVNGRHASIQKMIQGIEKDEARFDFDDKDDIFSIASVLKQYLRELPEPVFYYSQADRVNYTNDQDDINIKFKALRKRLAQLPPIHQTTFQAIIEHLGRVHAQSEVNRMGAKNLAVVFNSVIFGQDHLPSDGNVLNMNRGMNTLLEDLVTNSDLFFAPPPSPTKASDSLSSSVLSRSGLLPEAANVDEAHPGSSRTKFKILQPQGDENNFETKEKISPVNNTTAITMIPDIAVGEGSHTVAEFATINLETMTKQQSTRIFTPDEDLTLLFDPGLIPASVRDNLPDNIHIRPLASTDLLRKHFELLNVLRPSPALAPSMYQAIFSQFQNCSGTYYVLVMVDKTTDHLVASGTLIIERKYINGGGASGHLEDIVISEAMQGQKLGTRLIVGLRDMAVMLGCYKVVLDCKEAKSAFYEKCGFHKRSAGMAYYVATEEQSAIDPSVVDRQDENLAVGDSLAPPLNDPVESTSISESSTTPRIFQHDNDLFTQIEVGSMKNQTGMVSHNPDVELPGSPKTFTSASSGTGVTYTFPLAADEDIIPSWAAEGLGSSALKKSGHDVPEVLAGTGEQVDKHQDRKESLETPLPPGAAPPDLSAEPERI